MENLKDQEKIIDLSFYLKKDVVAIAKSLIGKVLHTCIDGQKTSGIIIETEAYAGITDRASHAYGGRRTQRTETMYKEGGIAYVYLCYGMHYMFNIVTNKCNIPHAVLIRGLLPVAGKEIMMKRLKKNNLTIESGNGPGKVCKLLGIDKRHNGLSLNDNTIWLTNNPFSINKNMIQTGKRIGVDYAGTDALLPYRFYLNKNDIVKLENNYLQ
ncbi:MAG: 3-methyladenine DNA glycosylase [Bacteroidetes bacterium ADurb.Bin408]|nr:MAG: 3-methyladenine DNA glycosylase [Bacteroidetes bacterium ADurb.Bin408]